MGERNSLLNDSVLPTELKNSRGRPLTNKCIKFSPQPSSIVSQLIKKMLADNTIAFPIEGPKEITTDSVPAEEFEQNASDIEEIDQIEEIYYQKPKKKHIDKCKNSTVPIMYTCDFINCSYSCKLSSNLLKHRRIHTGEKPYLCEQCSFRTNFSNSLRVHKRLHTTERPYQCTHCLYKCNSISNLKKHYHTKHNKNAIESKGKPNFT